MKQTRKMESPTWVTLGLVEAGVISGTPAAWATGAASSVREEEHSPISAMTRLREINRLAAVADSPGAERLSSTTNSTWPAEDATGSIEILDREPRSPQRGLAEGGVATRHPHEESDFHRILRAAGRRPDGEDEQDREQALKHGRERGIRSDACGKTPACARSQDSVAAASS